MEQSLTIYKASAGSGKTFALVVEYIKELLQPHAEKEFEHTLAVTFTNKATAEMKSRIQKAVNQGVPIVNYGIAIAHIHGILRRSLEIFPEILSMLDE